jgi:hypothetical protein
MNLAQDRERWQTRENGNITFGFHKLRTISWPALKKDSASWSESEPSKVITDVNRSGKNLGSL